MVSNWNAFKWDILYKAKGPSSPRFHLTGSGRALSERDLCWKLISIGVRDPKFTFSPTINYLSGAQYLIYLLCKDYFHKYKLLKFPLLNLKSGIAVNFLAAQSLVNLRI